MSTYIKEIEIEGLWGIHNFRWEVTPEVNILAGGNGSGKSTVLRCMSDLFRDGELSAQRKKLVDKVIITFDDGSKIDSDNKVNTHAYNVQSIRTFDMTMKESDTLKKLSNGDIVTELDWKLFNLHSHYLDYQLEVSKEVITALSEGRDTNEILSRKTQFFDIIDSLFASTNKKIDRQSNALTFTVRDCHISPYHLSAGEKQILIILTSVLVKNNQPSIMIMDEPEISLHFDWQKQLIGNIRALNDKTQLIMATHSPAVVMNGWVDRVSEISELFVSTTIF